MKSREDAARFIEIQMDTTYKSDMPEKKGAWHYGFQEMKVLFDYIYDGKPKNKSEEINQSNFFKRK